MKEISRETMEKIEKLLTHYPNKRSALLEVLHILQNEWGFIDEEGEERVASLLDISPVDVHEVVTFYTMFYRSQVGKYKIKICRNLTCSLLGSDTLLNYLRKKLKIDVGETTLDGKFTLETVECLGACELAPVMQINEEFYGRLTPEKIDEILEGLK